MDRVSRVSALRLTLLVIGAVMILWSIRLRTIERSKQAGIVVAVYGVILVAGLLFERWRYSPDVDRGAAGWQPTEEKFLDPVTGSPVQVWFNPKTGERDYRPI